MTAPELYFHIKKSLELSGISDSRFEAMCIAEHLFNLKLQQLLITKLNADPLLIAEADRIIIERIKGRPLQYILGKWEFYGLNFFVGDGVLIPRQDTETLVDFSLERLKNISNPKIADLCSGSGCIAAAISKNIPSAGVSAVEFSETAINYLTKNTEHNNVHVKIVHGDVLKKETADGFTNLDMIVANPPYISEFDMKFLQREVRFEPKAALFGGKDGLDFYRAITFIWKKSLKSGGILAYEIGAEQHNDIYKIMKSNGYLDIEFIKDLSGIIRVVAGKKQ